MSYNPQSKTREILDIAWQHIQSVPYTVTARWLFYRLLQAAILQKKSDYKLLLKVLSSARKGFYNGWAPDTLADDTRQAMIKGAGWRTGNHWLDGVKRMSCELDRWTKQDNYVEVWFEAAAMTSQFDHYTNGNVPLLAFHGDISIPEKWESAKRLKERYDQLGVPIVVLYYGDLDVKGIQIPQTAERDVLQFIAQLYYDENSGIWESLFEEFRQRFTFRRIGLNQDQIALYNVPSNPERPGTYQWEGLPDDGAQELIGVVDQYLNMDGFEEIEDQEDDITRRFRQHLDDLDLDVSDSPE